MAWNHVSPSQIESFLKCPRAWFFKSILKIPEAQKGHQSLGEAFHLIMEKVPSGHGWPLHSAVAASEEDWDKAEQLARFALPMLPDMNGLVPRGDPIFAKIGREYSIRLPTFPGGPTMVGFVDLGIPTGIGWEALLIPKEDAIVADYKTLSDFRYMRTPQELANGVQMMTYAKALLETLRENNEQIPEHIRLVHLYARTRPPFKIGSIRHESAMVSIDDIEAYWTKTLDVVHQMGQTALCADPDDVEAKGSLNGHCEAYGGCHFRDKCGISPSSGIKTLFKLGKTPTPESPTPQESPIMAGSSILEKIKAAQAAKAAADAAKATAASAPASSPSGATEAPTANSPAAATPTGIVPPDAPPRTQPVITQPGQAVADPEAEEDDDEGEEAAPTSSPSSTSSPVVVSFDVPLPAPAPKRGRPPKAASADADKIRELEDANTKLQAAVTLAKASYEAASQRIAELEASKPSPAPSGLTLYVDCVPTKGDRDCTDFFEWIGPICAQVARNNSVSDWRLINYTAKGLLASAIRETIQTAGLPVSMTICSYAGGADIALEILTPLAKRVIKKT